MSTRNKSLLALLAVIIGAAVFFMKRQPLASVPEAAAPLLQAEQAAPPKKLIDQVKEFKGLPEAKLSEQEKNSECRGPLEAIETLSLKTLIHELSTEALKLNSKCLSIESNNIDALRGFPEICEQLKDGQPSQECIKKLFLYKSLRIHHATLGDDLNGLPTEVLISKVVGAWAELSSSPENLKRIRDIGTKLYERLPDSESAAKAAVVGYMIDDSLSVADKKERDRLLDEARINFPSSWEIYEMDLIRKQALDEGSYKNEIKSFYARYPDSAIGIYYMGCVQWSEGQIALARQSFKSASAKSPGDQRMGSTLRIALATEPPQKVCAVQIGFDPDKLEYFY